ncbi:MAG: sulfotransferase family protein [Balneolaceae bacterium]
MNNKLLILLPELSRDNIHGMAPSTYFFKGLYRRLTVRNRKKVFVLGFHKTGTTSLAKALVVLGYRVCGFVNPPINYTPQTHTKDELFEATYKPLLNEYDVFEDTPWFIFYKELLELYPDAKFILTKRPVDKWYKSALKHFGGYDRKSYHWIYDGKGDPEGNKELYINKYTEHNEAVIKYFKKNNKELLVMNMPEDFNWDVICNFLNCSKPFGDFPHANSATDRVTIKRRLIYALKRKYYKWGTKP